ncbi:hypothetical protein ACOTJQ_28865 [Achromobacter xylosoxidans]|uniref:hypothetical protein n=1 Tax=Achromobacter ruhlandii TaxID=72557 RepID=UPI003B9A82A2
MIETLSQGRVGTTNKQVTPENSGSGRGSNLSWTTAVLGQHKGISIYTTVQLDISAIVRRLTAQ